MQDSFIFKKYQLLPDSLQQQVSDYIEFLVNKYQKSREEREKPQKKQKSNFGSAKGLIIMSDDFDDPIDEFKPYM
jgi:mRNA-degrading endonuclease RelE of RelBE toxin-antitoxin system